MSISHLDQNISYLDWGLWHFHHYHQVYAGTITWLCPNCFLPNHFQFISHYSTIIHCYMFWVSDSAIEVKININSLYCHKYYILHLHYLRQQAILMKTFISSRHPYLYKIIHLSLFWQMFIFLLESLLTSIYRLEIAASLVDLNFFYQTQ